MTSEAVEFALFALSVPAYLQSVGLMFSLAIVLGGLLDGPVKSVVRVAASLVVFVVTSEITRAALFPAIGQQYTLGPAVLIVLNAIIYLAGYLIGWMIGRAALGYAQKSMA